MKPLHVLILSSVLLIGGGLIVSQSAPPSDPPPALLMDRLNYLEYSQERATTASANGRVVLFFAAPWCSTCTALDDELQKKSNQLPPDITC